MRTAVLCCLLFLGTSANAAPPVDCAALAGDFRRDIWDMGAASLGRLRTCTDGEAWAASAAKTASAVSAGAQPSVTVVTRRRMSDQCKGLADTVADKGLKALEVTQRAKYRSCIDEAITTVSSQPRPGTTAHIPDRKKREELQG